MRVYIQTWHSLYLGVSQSAYIVKAARLFQYPAKIK